MKKQRKFKQTEIGRIPKEWEVAKIGEIGEVITGTTPSTKVKEYWGEGYLFVTPTDFPNEKYVRKTERSVTQKGVEKAKIIPKDSVMVTCIASIGEVAMSSEECITNQQINSIVCGEKANPHYIYYAMKFRKNVLKRWAGITTSPIIKKSLFEKFPIPLPSLPEQQKIAEILSTVDQAIEKAEEAMAKTVRLKKGLMQELLTKGIGHEEFKDTEIGKIPKEWKVVRLKEIVDINKESCDPKREFPEKKFLYIDIESIENERGIIKSVKTILGKEAPSRARRVIHYNDVIMSTVRPYLKAFAIVPKEYNGQICSTGFAVFSCKKDILPSYLLYVLFSKSVINQCNRMMVGAQYPALNNSQVEKIKIPLPPLPEQQKIAEILSTVDKRLELLRNKKEKLERIKKGLMNDLLTGKKRVNI